MKINKNLESLVLEIIMSSYFTLVKPKHEPEIIAFLCASYPKIIGTSSKCTRI
jgi:hypothetical protein